MSRARALSGGHTSLADHGFFAALLGTLLITPDLPLGVGGVRSDLSLGFIVIAAWAGYRVVRITRFPLGAFSPSLLLLFLFALWSVAVSFTFGSVINSLFALQFAGYVIGTGVLLTQYVGGLGGRDGLVRVAHLITVAGLIAAAGVVVSAFAGPIYPWQSPPWEPLAFGMPLFRAVGFGENPNKTGAILIWFVGMAPFLARFVRRRLLGPMVALSVVGALLTFSRSTVAALLGSILIALTLLGLDRLRRWRPMRIRLGAFGLAALMLGGVIFAVGRVVDPAPETDLVMAVASSRIETGRFTREFNERIARWRGGVERWEEVGFVPAAVGRGFFGASRMGGSIRTAHNQFITVLGDFGYLGLGLFVGALLLFLLMSLQTALLNDVTRIGIAGVVTTAGLLAHSLTEAFLYSADLISLVVLLMVLGHLATRLGPTEAAAEPATPAVPLSGSSQVTLLNLLNGAVRSWRLVLVVAVAFGALAALNQWIRPQIYTASSRLLPPEGGETVVRLQGPDATSAIPVKNLQVRLHYPLVYPELLKSRDVARNVLDRYLELDGRRIRVSEYLREELPPSPHQGEVIRSLQRAVRTRFNWETGLITLVTQASDPQASQQLNDLVIEAANAIGVHQRRLETREESEFLKRRLQRAESELLRAEDTMAAFLARNRNTDFPDRMQGGLLSAEDTLAAFLAGSTNTDFPERGTQGAQRGLPSSADTLAALFGWNGTAKSPVPPVLRVEWERLEREISLKHELFSSLATSYAASRLGEGDLPVFIVVEGPEGSVRGTPGLRPRDIALKALGCLFLGVVVAFTATGWSAGRRDRSDREAHAGPLSPATLGGGRVLG